MMQLEESKDVPWGNVENLINIKRKQQERN